MSAREAAMRVRDAIRNFRHASMSLAMRADSEEDSRAATSLIRAAQEAAVLLDPPDMDAIAGKREKGWMGTSTGRKFYPLDPRAEDVDVRDIARGLSMTCRYAGQVKRFYSVSEHVVLVSQHVDPRYRREALFHDSAEAYLGDMIRPLKHQMEMKAFRDAEAAIERVIFEALGLNMTPEAHAAIKEIDDRILVDEIKELSAMPEFYLETPLLRDKQPLGVVLECAPPSRAEAMFWRRYNDLFGD